MDRGTCGRTCVKSRRRKRRKWDAPRCRLPPPAPGCSRPLSCGPARQIGCPRRLDVFVLCKGIPDIETRHARSPFPTHRSVEQPLRLRTRRVRRFLSFDAAKRTRSVQVAAGGIFALATSFPAVHLPPRMIGRADTRPYKKLAKIETRAWKCVPPTYATVTTTRAAGPSNRDWTGREANTLSIRSDCRHDTQPSVLRSARRLYKHWSRHRYSAVFARFSEERRRSRDASRLRGYGRRRSAPQNSR